MKTIIELLKGNFLAVLLILGAIISLFVAPSFSGVFLAVLFFSNLMDD